MELTDSVVPFETCQVLVTGHIKTIRRDPDEIWDLKSLQTLVDGHIEIIPISCNRYMVIDEDGKLKDKPVNEIATAVWLESGHGERDYIVGDVVITLRSLIE